MKIAGKWLVPAEGMMLSGISAYTEMGLQLDDTLENPKIWVPKVKAVICESLRQKDSE